MSDPSRDYFLERTGAADDQAQYEEKIFRAKLEAERFEDKSVYEHVAVAPQDRKQLPTPRPLKARDFPNQLHLWPPTPQMALFQVWGDISEYVPTYIRRDAQTLEEAERIIAAWADFWTVVDGTPYNSTAIDAHGGIDVLLKSIFED